MSSFDIFVLILVIVAAFIGWRQGLLHQVGRLAGIILGIAACRIFGARVAEAVVAAESSDGDRIMYTILAYIGLFVVVYFFVTLVARMFKAVLDAIKIGVLNNLAGAVFNVAEWVFMFSLLLNLVTRISPIESLVGDPFYDGALLFAPYLLDTEAMAKIGSAVTGTAHG